MKLVLYYAPVTCALAPYITLTEAGARLRGAAGQSAQGRDTTRPTT